MKKVGIVMGSGSDLPVVRKAAETLASFGVPHEVHVYSAHRTPPGRGPGRPDHIAGHRHPPEIQRNGRR